jgi:hypothetical protein
MIPTPTLRFSVSFDMNQDELPNFYSACRSLPIRRNPYVGSAFTLGVGPGSRRLAAAAPEYAIRVGKASLSDFHAAFRKASRSGTVFTVYL